MIKLFTWYVYCFFLFEVIFSEILFSTSSKEISFPLYLKNAVRMSK